MEHIVSEASPEPCSACIYGSSAAPGTLPHVRAVPSAPAIPQLADAKWLNQFKSNAAKSSGERRKTQGKWEAEREEWQ